MTRKTSYLPDWDSSHAELYGKHSICLSHRLAESGLFSKQALAQIIETLPKSHYNINTMGYDHRNSQWREGRIGDHKGHDVIEAINRGRMWLNMRRLEELDSRYADLLDTVMTEFQDKVPGLATFKRSLGVLISSPNVRIFYHADVPGQTLWQIAGRKRLYTYPNTEPFLAAADMEKIVLGMTEEEIPYQPWFDNHARIFDLEPGQMVHWPLNGPHQVINEDCLNISVTTAHWTKEIRNTYAVNYANGVLRNVFGYTPKVTQPIGASIYPKAALALVWKKFNLSKARKLVRKIDFQVNPDSPTGMTNINMPIAE